MIRKGTITTIAVAALFAAACDRNEPTAPRALQATPSMAKIGGDCSIDIGATTRPLPALHELEGWLGDAIDAEASTVDCGLTRALDAKMEALAKALDQEPPNFDAACGISGALVAQVTALSQTNRLALPSFTPPFPGGPSDVLTAATFLNERWCMAARGELVGPMPPA
jgi:hypothetical protein